MELAYFQRPFLQSAKLLHRKDRAMESTIYLFAAFSLTWGIIFIYILYMLKRQKSLENRIDTLRAILESEHASEY